MPHSFERPFITALDFRDFSWLPLNNLLRLADLRCAFVSDSNWAFTGVSVKRAHTLDFLLWVSLRTPAFGESLMSSGLTWCSFPSEAEGPACKPDVEECYRLNLRFKLQQPYFSAYYLHADDQSRRRHGIVRSKYVLIKRPNSCQWKSRLDNLWCECIWQWLAQYEWDVVDSHNFPRITSDP